MVHQGPDDQIICGNNDGKLAAAIGINIKYMYRGIRVKSDCVRM